MATADESEETKRSYKAACFRRWCKLGANTPSPVCKCWYVAQADALLAADEGLDQVKPPNQRLLKPTNTSANTLEEQPSTESGVQPNENPTDTANASASDEGSDDDDIVDYTDPDGDAPHSHAETPSDQSHTAVELDPTLATENNQSHHLSSHMSNSHTNRNPQFPINNARYRRQRETLGDSLNEARTHITLRQYQQET